jgi:hypothetical protein
MILAATRDPASRAGKQKDLAIWRGLFALQDESEYFDCPGVIARCVVLQSEFQLVWSKDRFFFPSPGMMGTMVHFNWDVL